MAKNAKKQNSSQKTNVIVEQKEISRIIALFYWAAIVPIVIFVCKIGYAPAWLAAGFYFLVLCLSLHYFQKAIKQHTLILLQYCIAATILLGPGLVFSVSTNQPWVQIVYQYLTG